MPMPSPSKGVIQKARITCLGRGDQPHGFLWQGDCQVAYKNDAWQGHAARHFP